MYILKNQLYSFLKSKNINYLYHANTVGTSKTFIENGGLLSRKYVETRNLFQTYQESDEIDKKFNVWDDIFLDVKDLHGYFSRQNFYGPVVFVYRTEVLLEESLGSIRITKNNPIYWHDSMSIDEMYYIDLTDYMSDYENSVQNRTIQAKMITLGDSSPLGFNNLEKIIIDDPFVQANGIVFGKEAIKMLYDALDKVNLPRHIIEIRNCLSCFGCYCHSNYLHQVGVSELNNLFVKCE